MWNATKLPRGYPGAREPKSRHSPCTRVMAACHHSGEMAGFVFTEKRGPSTAAAQQRSVATDGYRASKGQFDLPVSG